jgi:MMPL family
VQAQWNPRKRRDLPRKIRGPVTAIDRITTEPAPGQSAVRVRLLIDDGEMEWSLLVAGRVLEDEIEKLRPKVGLAFVALSASPGTEIKIAATALAAGILLDATIVRAMLVPAVMSILGRWNWWLPHWAARVLKVEASPLRPEPAPRTHRQ